jgi:hypothetical protein
MPDRPIVFLDLDDTLFSSFRKSPSDLTLFEPVAYDRGGSPLSYMSPRQRAFFDWLRKDAEIVPTTGRNLDAYRRVRLPFAGHAILSHGGLILQPDGTPDAGWHDRVAGGARACRAALADLCEQIREAARAAAVDLRARVICDAGLDLYCSVKHNTGDAAALEAFAPTVGALAPGGWSLQRNDNNLAVMPPFVSKAAAVAYFLERLGGDPAFVVGIGDSLSDLDFLALTDLAMLPTRSQAFRAIEGAANGL